MKNPLLQPDTLSVDQDRLLFERNNGVFKSKWQWDHFEEAKYHQVRTYYPGRMVTQGHFGSSEPDPRLTENREEGK